MAVSTVKGIIKMPAEGDAVTMHVVKCEVVEGQFGEQVKFTDTRGDALFLPRASADRQLSRIGFADEEMVLYGDVDGNTLAFVRAHNDKMPAKPFWNIERVSPDDASHRPTLKEQAQAEAERVRKAKGLPADDGMNIGKLPFDDVPAPTDADSPYDDEDGLPKVKAAVIQSAIDERATKRQDIVELYRMAYAAAIDVQGPDSTAEALNAGAATIIIAWQKAGLC
jgi:hypothetical protein